MSGSFSAWGSSTGPPTEDFPSRFVSTLDSAGIIASNEIGNVSWAGLGIRAERIERRPAYRRMEEEAEVTEGAERDNCSARLAEDLSQLPSAWEFFSKFGNSDRRSDILFWQSESSIPAAGHPDGAVQGSAFGWGTTSLLRLRQRTDAAPTKISSFHAA